MILYYMGMLIILTHFNVSLNMSYGASSTDRSNRINQTGGLRSRPFPNILLSLERNQKEDLQQKRHLTHLISLLQNPDDELLTIWRHMQHTFQEPYEK
jgi:hypothetical protein